MSAKLKFSFLFLSKCQSCLLKPTLIVEKPLKIILYTIYYPCEEHYTYKSYSI